MRRTALVVDAAVKIALVALLVFAVARPDLPQFQGKAMVARALTYPLSALIVPLAWLAVRRRATSGYPYALDTLIVLPFLVDMAGNAVNLYDRVEWWDDAMHFVNWAILVAGFGQLLVRLPIGRFATFAHAVGFGATTAVLWELAEYVAFIRHSSELATAYTDTVGDLSLGLGGSILAGALTALLRRGGAAPTRVDTAPGSG
jgi:hypothetical protein